MKGAEECETRAMQVVTQRAKPHRHNDVKCYREAVVEKASVPELKSQAIFQCVLSAGLEAKGHLG